VNGSFPIRTPTDLAATALDRTHKFMTWLPGGYIKQEKLTKPSLFFVGLVMFFNWVNLDSKLRVAILGQDFDCVVTFFRFADWYWIVFIYWAFIWPYLFYFTMVQSLFSLWEPFVFSLGLIASAICCVGDFQRSRSRRPLLRSFYRHHGDDEEAPPRSPLPRRRTEADTRSQRSPLPRRLQFIGFYKSSFDSL